MQCDEDVGGGCCPDGTTCVRDGCVNMQSCQTLLRKHFTPRATIAGLFHGDKTDEAVHTGIKFGEVGVVKSSACHAFLRPSLFIMLVAAVITSEAIMR